MAVFLLPLFCEVSHRLVIRYRAKTVVLSWIQMEMVKVWVEVVLFYPAPVTSAVLPLGVFSVVVAASSSDISLVDIFMRIIALGRRPVAIWARTQTSRLLVHREAAPRLHATNGFKSLQISGPWFLKSRFSQKQSVCLCATIRIPEWWHLIHFRM